MKRRIIKSPIESSAAETILVPPLQSDRPKLNIQVLPFGTISKRATPDLLRRSIKKSQSSELIKVLSEKNLEIKKLQQENNTLSSQLTGLSVTIKKYQKLKSIIKKKNQTIEKLRKNSTQTVSQLSEYKLLRSSSRKNKNKRSRLSIDSELASLDLIPVIPHTASQHVDLHENTAGSVNKNKKKKLLVLGTFSDGMQNTLERTKKILEGWSKFSQSDCK